jgi:uncharacterized protein (TIGR00255 family)
MNAPRAPSPVASMTGFAAATRSLTGLGLTVELRSVNSRFLDLALRVPDELRQFEGALREAIAARCARGKVECRVALQRQPGADAPRLNTQALEHLEQLDQQVRARLPAAAPLSVSDVLHWPGVLDAREADGDVLREALLAALAEALDGMQASRQREGEALRQLLLERGTAVAAIAETLRPRIPEMVALAERKLSERLNQALGVALQGGGVSREELAERVRQEVTLYGLRVDVDEEIKRLLTHVAEVRRVLATGGAVGRRLDFLMQELNREANTLGSKATAVDLTQAAIELKVLIEQMREQIQNLE